MISNTMTFKRCIGITVAGHSNVIVQFVTFFFKDFALCTSLTIGSVHRRCRMGVKDNVVQLNGALWTTSPPLLYNASWILCLSSTSHHRAGLSHKNTINGKRNDMYATYLLCVEYHRHGTLVQEQHPTDVNQCPIFEDVGVRSLVQQPASLGCLHRW